MPPHSTENRLSLPTLRSLYLKSNVGIRELCNIHAPKLTVLICTELYARRGSDRPNVLMLLSEKFPELETMFINPSIADRTFSRNENLYKRLKTLGLYPDETSNEPFSVPFLCAFPCLTELVITSCQITEDIAKSHQLKTVAPKIKKLTITKIRKIGITNSDEVFSNREAMATFINLFTNVTHLVLGTRVAETCFDWGRRNHPSSSYLAEELPIPIILLLELNGDLFPFPQLEMIELHFIKLIIPELMCLGQFLEGEDGHPGIKANRLLDMVNCFSRSKHYPIHVELPVFRKVTSSTFKHD